MTNVLHKVKDSDGRDVYIPVRRITKIEVENTETGCKVYIFLDQAGTYYTVTFDTPFKEEWLNNWLGDTDIVEFT